MASTSIHLRLTDRGIDAALKKQPDLKSIYDTQTTGLRLHKGKTWYLTRRIGSRVYDRKLGDRSMLPIAEARKKAAELFLQLDKGEDPKEIRKQQRAEETKASITVKAALELMLKTGNHKERTKASYLQLLGEASSFRKLADEPLFTVTGDQLKRLHHKQSRTSPSQANKHARTIRALHNWACAHYGVVQTNPADALAKRNQVSGSKGWNRNKRRKSVIQRHQLKPWLSAVRELQTGDDSSLSRQAYALEVMLLTGLRVSECLGLRWSDVDQPALVISIPASRSKNGLPLDLPISSRVLEIIKARTGDDPDLVFPAVKLKKPLYDCRRALTAIQEKTGIQATHHDLRRTFASAAPAAGVNQELLKALMNHSTDDGEITAGYQTHDIDTLRQAIQKIEDFILSEAGLLDPGMEQKLIELIRQLPEKEKRKLLFELSALVADREVSHG